MPSLPIPVFGAMVLLFLFVWIWIKRKRIGPLAILLAVCAIQSVIIAMAQHYLVPGMRFVQPITATLIPPIAWLVYQITAVRPARHTDLVQGLAPFTALAALVTAPEFLDVLIPGVFVVYGMAILVHCRQGPDAQHRVSLESGGLPSRIWFVIGVALIASASSDVLIVAARMAGMDYLQPWIISVYSVGNLLLIGALSLSGHLQTDMDQGEATTGDMVEFDHDVWQKVEHYMTERRPYLDPDLTLSKLSRKLGVPAKVLSSTINRATQENVSRYVNKARIDAARKSLLAGENVTSAMLSSGFNTKSNFNREFLRVTGKSPSKWLAENRQEQA